MEIIFDHVISRDGIHVGVQLVDTSVSQVVTMLKGLHVGTLPLPGTGWDEITKHPSYPGQTRLQAVIAEIIRLNDAPTRATLGV